MATRKLGFSALQKAYYTRLTTDPLTSSYTVTNFPLPSQSMPYISFGTPFGVRSMSLGACDTEGEENVMIINVWSDEEGDKEASEMMNNVVQAIHASALTITGYTDVLALMEYASITVDDSVKEHPVRHGVIRFSHHMA